MMGVIKSEEFLNQGLPRKQIFEINEDNVTRTLSLIIYIFTYLTRNTVGRDQRADRHL